MNLSVTQNPKAFLAAALQEKAKRIKFNKLKRYVPYPKQREFHNAGAIHRERLYLAANRCVSPWTFIETVDATVQSVKVFFSKDARVLSWDGESQCVAQISGGYLKDIEPAYRLVMESGRWFDCTATHQVLTESGYRRVDQLMSLSSGLHLSHKAEDYQANCVAYGYLCDPQLRAAQDTGQGQTPLSVGVPTHNLIFSHKDAEALKQKYTSAFQQYDHLTTFDYVPDLILGLIEPFSCAAVSQVVLLCPRSHQDVLRFVSGLGHLFQEAGESLVLDASAFDQDQMEGVFHDARNTPEQHAALRQFDPRFQSGHSLENLVQRSFDDVERIQIFYPFKTPALVGGEKIVAIVPIGYQPIIDTHIPVTNSYKAAGVFHHNCGKTEAGAAEMAMHLTGRYPDWWEGRRFGYPINAWAAGITSESTRDVVQEKLLGPYADKEEWGSGYIPKECLLDVSPARSIANAVDSVVIRHINGGQSYLGFKSYEKGREKWQGTAQDVVWLDEECPPKIYSEAMTRTSERNGILFMTFTPLNGYTEVVRSFLTEGEIGEML